MGEMWVEKVNIDIDIADIHIWIHKTMTYS